MPYPVNGERRVIETESFRDDLFADDVLRMENCPVMGVKWEDRDHANIVLKKTPFSEQDKAWYQP